jgi:hypothetical protein
VTGHDGVATMSSTATSGTEIYDIVNGTSTEMVTVVYRIAGTAGGYTTAGTFSTTPVERRCATVAYKASVVAGGSPLITFQPIPFMS